MALRAVTALTLLAVAGTAGSALAQGYPPYRPNLPPTVVNDDQPRDSRAGISEAYTLPPAGLPTDRGGMQQTGYSGDSRDPRLADPRLAAPQSLAAPQGQGYGQGAPSAGFIYPDDPAARSDSSRQDAILREAMRQREAARYGAAPAGPAGQDPRMMQQQPSTQQQPGPDGMRPPGAVGSMPAGQQGYGQQGYGQSAPAAGPIAGLPPEDQPEVGEIKELPPHLKRQLVDYQTKEPAGTIVIDTQNTYLYLVLGDGKAMRYGIGVGREGFTWSGSERVSRMAEWPDWRPPSEMIDRQPYLPRFMAGGPGNPMGARALYLGQTLYRIHGTNQPSTIGTFVSSGCVRLVNNDVEDLYSRVKVGAKVVVLPGSAPATAASSPVSIAPVAVR